MMNSTSTGAEPLVSIIIPTYNKWEYTVQCLQKVVENTQNVSYEIIIVDNASTDATREALPRFAEFCRIQLNETNLGFASACNQGARMARGKYLLFLNNDTEPQPGWLEAMVKVAQADPAVAMVGSKLVFPDGTLQHGGVGFAYAASYPITPFHINYRKPAIAGDNFLELQAVTAACMLVRSQAFNAVGGFDEEYLNGYEDVDLCLKIHEAGGRIIYTPKSVVIHHESISENRHLKEFANIDLLHRRWLDKLTVFDFNSFADIQPSSVDPARPGVSIVVVAYNSLRTIAPCLESLMLHTGPQDEIILVDNASQDATMQFVKMFMEKHPGRIRVISSERNLGFSMGTNLGLEMASKEYVALVNPDVEVTSGWLDRMVSYMAADPKVGAVGPTADYVAGLQKVGLYVNAINVPSWDALSTALAERNRGQGRETPLLIGFCLLGRRELLREIGNLDPNLFLGNDDLDLSLQLRQKGFKLLVATDVFVHHFGQVSFSTEPGPRTKYLVQQSTNALYEKLYGNYSGRVPSAEELWGISWFTPQTGLASIIIPIHNNPEEARQCIAGIYRHTPRDFELILVDNGPTEDMASYAGELQKTYGNVTYLRHEFRGYSDTFNQGLAAARGEYVALLDSDILVPAGWLGKLLALLSVDPAMGMVGFPSVSAGNWKAKGLSGLAKDLDELAARHFLENAGSFSMVDRLAGGGMVLRRQVIDRVGGFDTRYREADLATGDLCLRVKRAGFQIAIARDLLAFRLGDASTGVVTPEARSLVEEDWRFFCQKWNHRGEMEKGFPALELVQARPFDPAWDHIPFRYEEIFHPDAAPMDLPVPHPIRFLCIPDWGNPAWKLVVSTYARTFKPSDPVSLIIRLEPPMQEDVEKALGQIATLLRESGILEEDVADICVEVSKIPPRRGGGLYTAATAFIPCAGSRAVLYAGEARACGLPVLDELSEVALRRLARAAEPKKRGGEGSPKKKPGLTSIVILTHNELEFTRRCVESIQKYTQEPYELIFVDNGSTDGTLEYLQRLSGARVIANPINLGFGAGCNQGMSAAKGEYIVLLNNDTVVTEGWLAKMIERVESDPSVGMVGPRSNYVVGPQLIKPVPYGDDLSRMHEFAGKVSAENAGTSFQIMRLVGFCILMKRAVIEKIGGFDERFGQGNFEDDDFCLRANLAGFKLLVCNDVFIHHFGSRTFAGAKMDYLEMMRRNWKKFKDKWDLPVDKPMEAGYRADEVLNRVFDANMHYSPLPKSPDDFASGMEPAFNEKRGFSFLVMPDWPGDQDLLRAILNAYLDAFAANDDVSLILLIEENEEVQLQPVGDWLVEEIKARDLDVDRVPDILLTRRPDSPRNRLAIYRSVQAYLPTGELLEEAHRKELQACGCQVVEECTSGQLGKMAGIQPARRITAS